MRTIFIIAVKEIQEGMRNRWVLATTLLLAALALSLTFLGSAPTGNVGAGALDVVVVSLSSLTIFLLPLIALLISHDAVVGEMERGTMTLLLSYPVGRSQVILGKFCGHVLILGLRDGHRLRRRGGRAGDDRRLGTRRELVCLRLDARNVDHAGCGLRRDWLPDQQPGARQGHRRRPLGGGLVADGAGVRHGTARHPGRRSGEDRVGALLEALLFLNPTDLYRMTNLTGFNVSQFSGMAGLAGTATHEPWRATDGTDGLGRAPSVSPRCSLHGESMRRFESSSLSRHRRLDRMQAGGGELGRAAAGQPTTGEASGTIAA